jgi:hypothetical protein
VTAGSENVGGGAESGGHDGVGSTLGYPVVLGLAGRRCLVVGGGPVAARRARGLAEVGALVSVVALRASPSLVELVDAGVVTLETRAYLGGEATHYDLVVTRRSTARSSPTPRPAACSSTVPTATAPARSSSPL